MRYIRTRFKLTPFGLPRYSVPGTNSELPGLSTRGRAVPSLIGMVTRRTNIDAASGRSVLLLRQCQRRVKGRDFSALLELLDEEPFFIFHPWVDASIKRFRDHPRFGRQKRGRPKKSYASNPLALLGLVESLLDSGRAKNRHQAFSLIEEWRLTSYDTAKRTYRRELGNTAPREVMIEYLEGTEYVSEAEAEAVRKSARELRPNEAIRLSEMDRESGQPEIVLKAGDAGRKTDNFAIITGVSMVDIGRR